MSPRALPSLSAAALGIALVAVAPSAHADPPPNYAQQPAQAQYPAPLSQTTQPTYVPQSVAMSGPSELDYSVGDPVPAGYRPVERTRKGLIIGGAILFGSLYSLSLLTAAAGADSRSGSSNEYAALWVPVVGPFVQMTQTETATGKLFLAVDGLGQGAGAAMLLVGLLSPKTVLVRNDLAATADVKPEKPKVHAVPLFGNGTTGVGLVGTF